MVHGGDMKVLGIALRNYIIHSPTFVKLNDPVLCKLGLSN